MTKKDIYAKYGIEYANGKVTTPIGKSCELLKKGNSKTGAKVLTWSMNQTTCRMHCEGCYADRGCYNFSNVKKTLAFNTELATRHLDFWKSCIMAQLETLPEGTEIRIHAVGDFFGPEYVKAWHDIAEAFPGLVFWTYTKTEYENAFDDLPNANIVKSLIDGRYNFGHCEYVMGLYDELKTTGKSVHICKCGVDDNQHCEGCHKCSISEYVLFLEHSTDYVAENDPAYSRFVEMVNNQ